MTDPWGKATAALIVLDHFDNGDDPGPMSVQAALSDLAAALGEIPDHPDSIDWELRLALGHAGLAWTLDGSASAPHWNEAVRGLRHLRRLTVTDPDADAILVPDLALAIYLRFQSLASGWAGAELENRFAEIDADLAALGQGDAVVEMVAGLVDLRRFGRLQDRIARDRALGRLATALPALPDDTPLLPEALTDYALALDTVVDDPAGDAERRDLGIAALERAAELLSGRPPQLLRAEGEQRCFRGEEREDAAEIRRGIALLTEYLVTPDVDDADSAYVHAMLATANEYLWRRCRDAEAAEAVGGHVDAALAAGIDRDDLDLGLELRRRAVNMLVERKDDALRTPERRADARDRLVEGIAVLAGAPDADAAARAELALPLASLGIQLIGSGPGLININRLPPLLDIARTHPRPEPMWQGWRDAVTSQLELLGPDGDFAKGKGSAGDIVTVLRRFGLLDLLSEDEAEKLNAELSSTTVMTAYLEGLRTGDRSRLLVARELLAARRDDPSLAVVAAFIDLQIAHLEDVPPDQLLVVVRRLLDAVIADEDDSLRDYLLPYLRQFSRLLGDERGEGVDLDDLPPEVADDPMAARMRPLTMSIAALVELVRGDPQTRRATLQAEQDRIKRAARGSAERLASGMTLAIGWLEVARSAPLDRAAVQAAIRWGTECLDGLGGPTHPLWAQQALTLATALRLRGGRDDRGRGRELGFDALRGRAWSALLQAGSTDALDAARTASADAAVLAGWCAQDQVYDDVARAVEAGRGLALHAATTTRGVHARLVDLGHGDLADEWAAVGGVDHVVMPGVADVDLRGDLRQRVLAALQDGDPGLLDPPVPDRVRAALRHHGTHALVYLVPGHGEEPGRMVAVPAHGPVEVRELPGLDAAPGGPLARYAAAYAAAHRSSNDPTRGARDISVERPPDPRQSWASAVADLGRWAWASAGEALLEGAARWAAGALPRLVLVPAGTLALVPWGAAVRTVHGRERYLVADAVLSTAASARLYCESVSRHRVRNGEQVLLGDPTGNLRGADLEVRAIGDVIAPGATHLGLLGGIPSPAGSGTVAEVLARLVVPHSLLHLACHGTAVATEPAASYLDLHDGMLPASLLLDQDPTRPLPLDTVVLSACSTHVVGDRYDEAFSLATAFLAAGARTVIGSLWNIPDGPTSWLAFLFHRHRSAGAPPADALRAAQLWMLDPDSDVPDALPALLHTANVGDIPLRHPLLWAGLTHLGR